MRRVFNVVIPRSRFVDDVPLVCRVVTSAIFLSHDIRRDVTLRFVMPDAGLSVSFLSSRLRHVHVDEQSFAGLHRRIVRAMWEVESEGGARHPHSGISVERIAGNVEEQFGGSFLVSSDGELLADVLRRLGEVREISLVFSAGFQVRVPRRVRVSVERKNLDVLIVIANIEIDNYLGA
ncbi:RNA methyltransferase [Thermofilum pendens]|uniref:tRNA (pseudouridine(54)-N(1))-methyltransferase n=1 Tax=Thermofilum pendens (strain DSM 2475 / Hrk 5) TaxID=368408 RepID=A1RXD9_THEPD|nr:hypothetical protein [Thermofilum pendens]ABL77869.1 protein of unknown function DUF358 [Thermofilum pendens Hrk 5]